MCLWLCHLPTTHGQTLAEYTIQKESTSVQIFVTTLTGTKSHCEWKATDSMKAKVLYLGPVPMSPPAQWIVSL